MKNKKGGFPMNGHVRRIFVEKRGTYAVEARNLYNDLHDNLGIEALTDVRIINRYDVSGISDEVYNLAKGTIFSEPHVDKVWDEEIDIEGEAFAIEYLPGQYDQRADSAAQCIQILTQGDKPIVRTAKLIVLEGDISKEQFQRIKNYCINPVESREASLEKPSTIELYADVPQDVDSIDGFIYLSQDELKDMIDDLGLAMSIDDIRFCQRYFRDEEKRDPTITEIRVLDTYWSDHCRHTTFLTKIEEIKISDDPLAKPIKSAYEGYMKTRDYVYDGRKAKDICLMDMATIAMKAIKKQGMLDDLDESDEINACSIVVPVDRDGKIEEWLIMFKNETHNHPTEIEPFGGAATCLGGAIRDPLSGRAYVYQAMRITGSGDPRIPLKDTLPGKLPQRKITNGAAAGYSSYGNQIGLSTGQVVEIYDEGYVAKRMELGAVIGAAPRENVVRKRPVSGDVVILLGGRTGRDGCGGATGSSKAHTEESLESCGAEVQKGNPLEERKIQRLFRNPDVTRMIKKCNDFGAGGVSVAIGELAPGLFINLDTVPKKYEGLDGTELAISESQERMAVLISKDDAEKFIRAAEEENLEATLVAYVTEEERLRMVWRDNTIVNISRDFLDSNGASQRTTVEVLAPDHENVPFNASYAGDDIGDMWLQKLQDLNICSQKGLAERFDSTIGAGTVLMPFGGKYQLTPAEGMAAKVPVLEGDTTTTTLMTYGYNPNIAKWSPFHGAVYAIVEAVAKVVAMGGDYKKVRLTLQEYFERLGNDPKRWGKPFSALMGAYYAQMQLGLPAIGGKDSMSGSFNDLDVPPTLVAFAVCPTHIKNVLSPEFKKPGSKVVYLPLVRDDAHLPDFKKLDAMYTRIYELINDNRILSAQSIRYGGVCEAISKMCFGNKIGFKFNNCVDKNDIFNPAYGSLIVEIGTNEDVDTLLNGIDYKLLGDTTEDRKIVLDDNIISIEDAIAAWEKPLETVFPTKVKGHTDNSILSIKSDKQTFIYSKEKIAKPRVLIPVFPGTNCEYDSKKAFEKAGALVDVFVFRNLTPKHIEDSLDELVKRINNAQIIMLPGGFSGGDEPDGSGKFIATAFRNQKVSDAVMDMLKNRDGLMLGICNGFQALIKLGLVPYGEIRELKADSPTLTYNTIGRHMSCMVRTKVVSTMSPWFMNVNEGDMHTLPISHGEGRFVASDLELEDMMKNGQIATQYVDLDGNPTYDMPHNPNGSMWAVEGITSPDGRILGKMGHSERIGNGLYMNIKGEKDQGIFEAGVRYFK